MNTILNLPEQFFWNGHGRKISLIFQFQSDSLCQLWPGGRPNDHACARGHLLQL